MLQADCNHSIRFASGFAASLSLVNRPGHCLLRIQVLAGSYCVQKVAGMAVKRRRHDDRLDVFHILHTPVVVDRSYCWSQLCRLVVPPLIDIGDGNEFDIGDLQEVLDQLLPAPSGSDDAEPDAIVRSEHTARFVSKADCRSSRRMLQEISSPHKYPPLIRADPAAK